ncbi:phosphatidylglycerophosphatase and protein-tyrosine phosphatase 1 family protein [Bremerella cremea]|uniref:phosphatidylglycerophosphatase and protein-tyrosine phosphatase 1 family protein n=1 Tax=Bremerella cremea TaxID=1031537 RepID=UPI001F39B12E|nr:phosphatidylglycerophosphatase and protein-tyrosine phosphatase 1 family protein [Bremerella cremea]
MKRFLQHLYARMIYWPSYLYNWTMIRRLKWWRWYDEIDEHVFVGAVPSRQMAEDLAASGIAAVINTCQEYEGPLDIYEEHGIEQLYLPTIDFTPPSVEDIDEGVRFIEKYVAAGKDVYVHCKAGRARSATIVLCWLMKTKGMTPEQAQVFMKEKRRQVLSSIYLRPVVQTYYRGLHPPAKS